MKKHQNRNPEIHLENYIDDLIHKRPTTQPADVDDDMALIIGALMQDAEIDSPDEDVQEQLWNRTLFMIHCHADQPPQMADEVANNIVVDGHKTVELYGRPEQESYLDAVPQTQRQRWLQQLWSSSLPDGFQLDVKALVGMYQHVAVMVVALSLVMVLSNLLLRTLDDTHRQSSDTPAYITAAHYTQPEAEDDVFDGIVKSPRYFPALLDTTGIYPSTAPIGYPVSVKPRESSSNVHLPWMLNMFTIPQ